MAKMTTNDKPDARTDLPALLRRLRLFLPAHCLLVDDHTPFADALGGGVQVPPLTARELALSDSTVKTHVQAIFDKLGLSSPAQAVDAQRPQALGARLLHQCQPQLDAAGPSGAPSTPDPTHARHRPGPGPDRCRPRRL